MCCCFSGWGVKMYREDELVSVARRENNSKRSYLVVNRKQGKHVPVSPGKAFALYRALADEIKGKYEGKRLLIIGFAETATAIGAALAAAMDSFYMQTTRENIENVNYIFFSESHSHATEQRLVKDDLDSIIDRIDHIIFAEDELTTGSTILSAIDRIEGVCGRFAEKIGFSAVSILNGMDAEAVRRYRDRGVQLHFLIKTDHERYSHIADRYKGDGIYHEAMCTAPRFPAEELFIPGGINARRLVLAADYQRGCHALAERILKEISFDLGDRILVLGTEEFMYPALYFGRVLEDRGFFVRSHSTTRSPIVVSGEPEYPLHCRYELVSLYEKDRIAFIYDLEKYDKVVLLTDVRRIAEEGRRSLINALNHSGNKKIFLVRWCEGEKLL